MGIHGIQLKVMEKQYAGQKHILKLKKVAYESETGFNFSRKRHRQTFSIL